MTIFENECNAWLFTYPNQMTERLRKLTNSTTIVDEVIRSNDSDLVWNEWKQNWSQWNDNIVDSFTSSTISPSLLYMEVFNRTFPFIVLKHK